MRRSGRCGRRSAFFIGFAACVAVASAVLPASAAVASDSLQMHQLANVGSLHAPDATSRFGAAVAISGDIAIVGAPLEDRPGLGVDDDAGAVYLFRHRSSGWEYHGKLTADSPAAGDRFGASVDVLQGTILVGAPGDDGPDAEPLVDAGCAYVYPQSLVGGVPVWKPELSTELTASVAAAGDRFGHAVALGAGYAVVTAPDSDPDGTAEAGVAYVFAGSGPTWEEQARLLAADGSADDRMGTSVAVSGETIMLGAPNDDGEGVDAGAAYVFARSGGFWAQEATLTAGVHAAEGALFGCSVALDGLTALVGASGTSSGAGAAHVFVRPGATFGSPWSWQAKLAASDGAPADAFGSAVAVSGNLAIVGATGDDGKGTDAGSAYAFMRAGALWTRLQEVTASNTAAGHGFGAAVDVLDGTALVGAPLASSATGSAYLFGARAPVFRFYNKKVGTHFYTPWAAERDMVIAKWPTIFRYEGVAYYTNPFKNTQPLYRFFNKKNGSHFYTASLAEKNSIISKYSATYAYEGEAYKVSLGSGTASTPVYRFYNKRNGSHFFTASEAERYSVQVNLAGVYTFEGVAYWLGY